jgi:predicted RNA binding protein YcfA (HicA-like mRNA interferase family)
MSLEGWITSLMGLDGSIAIDSAHIADVPMSYPGNISEATKSMGKLANISGKEAARAFQKAGWKPVGQVGSHLVLIKPGVRVNLSIPQHKELSVGTLRALIRASGMTVEEFIELL